MACISSNQAMTTGTEHTFCDAGGYGIHHVCVCVCVCVYIYIYIYIYIYMQTQHSVQLITFP